MIAKGISIGLRLFLVIVLLCLGFVFNTESSEVRAVGTVDLSIDVDHDTADVQSTITVLKGSDFYVDIWVQPQGSHHLAIQRERHVHRV